MEIWLVIIGIIVVGGGSLVSNKLFLMIGLIALFGCGALADKKRKRKNSLMKEENL